MGKSWNKNQDRYNKYDNERRKRDRKKKHATNKNCLTPYGEGGSVDIEFDK